MLLNVSRGSVTGTGVFHEKYVPQLYGQTIFPALYDRRGICHQEQGTESHHQVQCPVPPFLSPTVVFFAGPDVGYEKRHGHNYNADNQSSISRYR